MKNLERYIIVILIFIALGAIGTSIYFGIQLQDIKKENKENDKNDDYLYDITYALMNEGEYSLKELESLFGEEVYGKRFINDINEEFVSISYDGQNFKCKFDDVCEINPDWLTIIFKKADSKTIEHIMIAEELMKLYIAPITQVFEGEYTNSIKTLLLINISEDIAKIADCKKLYGDKAKYEGDFEGQAGGYIVKEESDVYIDAGSFCEQDSKYYDAKLLREKSLELFGEDILVKQEIQDGWGSSFDYIENEDGYVYLSCRGGTGPTGNQYEIVSSSIKDNQFLIDFDYYVTNEKKTYTIIFDVKDDGKYIFNDLIKQ